MPFSLQRNDITRVNADAYVLAANPELWLGGGVAGAIAKAAGREELQAACDELGGCAVGDAVVTPGFGARATWIIHAVGPVWRPDEDAALLRTWLKSAYLAALARAGELGVDSVAMPLLSAGTFGCPEEISLEVALEAVGESSAAEDLDVIIVLFGESARNLARQRFADVAEYIDNAYVAAHPNRRSRRFEEEEFFFGGYGAPASRPSMAAPAMAAPPLPTMGAAPSMAAPTAVPDTDAEDEALLKRLFRKRSAGRGRAKRAEEPEESVESSGCFGAPVPDDLAVSAMPAPEAPVMEERSFAAPRSLEDFLDELDAPFSTTLLALIDERGLTDAQVYKRANISRQHFAKIRADADYRPTKKTVLALAVALRLTLTETEDLLARAGFALSSSSKADLIVRYFIERSNFDIFAINEALYAFDQPLLA